MKAILCLTLILVFLGTGISEAKVPDLKGRWSGMESWYGEVNGTAQLMENYSLNLTVTDQKGNLFTGNLEYALENGTKVAEGFAGVIGMDDKTLYLSEFKDGYDLGTVISDNEIELVYLIDGKDAQATIAKLDRIKA